MPIVLDCPGCGKRYDVDSALAGKKSRCKQCGEVFRIPAVGGPEAPAPPSPVPAAERSAVLAGALAPPRGSASSWESILPEQTPPVADQRPSARRASGGAPAMPPPAATIVIDCPGCGKRYELSGALAGKKSRCRQCGEVFAIAVPQTSGREPEAITMALLPEEPSAKPMQNPPESYWESVLADDPNEPAGQKSSRLPDYDDFDVPSRGASPRVKKSGIGRDTTIGVLISGWFSVALFVLLAGAYGAGFLGLLSKSQVSGFIGISLALTMMVCGILIIWGTVWLVVVAFREQARCGIMFLFVPLYPLYYIWTRMAETKGPASMVAVAYFVIIGMAILGPAVDPSGAPVAQSQPAAEVPTTAPIAHPPQPPGSEPITPARGGLMVGERNRMPFGPGPGFGLRPGGLPRNMPPTGPPAQFLDQWAKHLQAIASRYGNTAVVLAFTGLPSNSDPARGVTNREVWDAIEKRVKALAPGIEAVMSFGSDNQKALIVAPIDNPAALAQSIDFGKVTLQRDTRIRVDLSPDFVASVPRLAPEPAWASRNTPGPSEPTISIPADADPVTKSLLQLKSADMGQKKDAVHRLERTAPDKRLGEVVAALLPLLSEDDGFLVNDVMKALLVWRSPDVLPALIRRADDNRFFVRKEAVKALGKFKDPRAIEAIVTHFREDGFEAEAALKEIGPMAEPALIARLQDGDPHVRRVACDILRQIGGAETLKAMRALPLDPDLGVRMAAKRAAEQIVVRVGLLPRTSGSKNAGTNRRP